MNVKYDFDGRFRFKGKIPGIGKLDLDVRHLDAKGDVSDELIKELFELAYKAGLQLDKEMELSD